MHRLTTYTLAAALSAALIASAQEPVPQAVPVPVPQAVPAQQPIPAPQPAQPAPAPKAPAPAAQERPVVKDVEVRGGPRGLLLIINGTGPLVVDGLAKPSVKYQNATVQIANAGSALGATTLTPPAGLPINELVVGSTATGISIRIKLRSEIRGPMDVRASDHQVRVLLTRDSMPDISWSSSKGLMAATPKPAPAPAPAPAAVAQPVAKAAAQPAAAPAVAPAKAAAPAPVAQPQKKATGPQIAPKTETPALQPQPNVKPDSQVVKKSPEGELVRYKVFGRDPFVPLMRDTTNASGLPRVENLKLVGVLEDTRERIALVEDFKSGGKAFALRKDDPVEYGKVLVVNRDKVVFLIRDFDVSRSYTLELSK